MSKFLIKRLSSLEEYVPGEQPRDKKYIKLNTNESPFPPSPKAIEAIKEKEKEDLRLYSDPECKNRILQCRKRKCFCVQRFRRKS